jgi:transcriptional regulator with XRE-family HTH domain
MPRRPAGCACDCHSPLKVKFSRAGEQRGELVRLAGMSGVSESMISNTISGRKTPSVKTLVMLALALTRLLGRPVTVDSIVRSPAVWKRLSEGPAE